jgi:hypothetical protein
LLQLFRNHWSIEWSIENSQHQVKDRSWDEDHHLLRRPGLGEVFATLVNVSLNTLRLEGLVSRQGVHGITSQKFAPLAQNRLSLG